MNAGTLFSTSTNEKAIKHGKGLAAMTSYRRIRLGQRGSFLDRCLAEGWAGLDYGLHLDLAGQFPSSWREFNSRFIPQWLELHPGKNRRSAGLACALLWVFGHELKVGDVLLAPDEAGDLHIGRVSGPYSYHPGDILPHRRPVDWMGKTIPLAEQEPDLRASIRGALSLVDVSPYQGFIQGYLSGRGSSTPETHQHTFVFEKHLEDFLERNWASTALGLKYELFSDEDSSSRQFPTDTGPIDLLAISKDGTEYLVVELKRARASDAAVGQILRYMAYVKEQIAEPHQTVSGAIIALEDDLRLRRALQATTGITFFQYVVSFDLIQPEPQ